MRVDRVVGLAVTTAMPLRIERGRSTLGLHALDSNTTPVAAAMRGPASAAARPRRLRTDHDDRRRAARHQRTPRSRA